MCMGIRKQTLSDSMFHPSLLSIITAIPPVQALPWPRYPLYLRAYFPSLPPWLRISLANIHLVRRSQSAFGLSFLSSRAYSWFLVFKHIESQFLRLAFETFHQLILPTPISLQSLFSLFSSPAKQLCLSTRTYGLLISCLSLSVCEHIPLLLANPCLSLQDPASNTLLWEASSD